MPSFGVTFTLGNYNFRRTEDKFRDVEQGFWLIYPDDNDATKAAMKMDFDEFDLVVDSKKTVHNFLIELNAAPEKHCGLPQNALLGWRKSQPKTILVATYLTQNIPKRVGTDNYRKSLLMKCVMHYHNRTVGLYMWQNNALNLNQPNPKLHFRLPKKPFRKGKT